MKTNFNLVGFLFLSIISGFLYSCENHLEYAGKPWHDSAQVIPGRLECEKFDMGGEGVAYGDSDVINNGSGKLNPDNGSFLNTFRMKEAVDISYTKQNGVDNNPYNFVEPEMGELYVGWTVPGEWIRYSVEILKSGKYKGSIMYTSRFDGVISMDLDGKEWMKQVSLVSTFQQTDTVAWRQWHHWNRQMIFDQLYLPAGNHILTLHTVKEGNMNYNYIDFELEK